MTCPNCNRDTRGDGRFCQWCGAFILDRSLQIAGLFPRWVAAIIDFIIGWGLLILVIALAASHSSGAAGVAFLVLAGSVVGWFALWRRGLTPGKAVLGLRVIRTDGTLPGIPTMLLRDWIGKYVDGILFGVGWFWAIFDKDRQAWHDKMAGTVVVRANRVVQLQPAT